MKNKIPGLTWKSSGKSIPVQVCTLDAELNFNLKWQSTGQDLFDLVCRTIGLRETYYFGLQFEDSKGHITWLKMDKQVQVQCVLKDQENQQAAIKFMFLVKFYPEDVTKDLIQEVTQHLFFLQVKQAILSMDICCSAEASVLLASYALQAKYGDFEEYQSAWLADENLLPQNVIDQYLLSTEMWKDEIMKWYLDHRGMFRIEAEMEYLKIAQDLEMYGVHYFPITNTEKTAQWLGITPLGLNVYGKENKLQPNLIIKWSDIKEFGFTGKKFIIKPIEKNIPNYVYISKEIKMNKLIINLCIGNHSLFMHRRKPDSMETQQMKAAAKEEKHRRQILRDRLAREKQLREEAERERAAMEQKVLQYQEEVRIANEALRRSAETANLLAEKNRVVEEEAILLNQKALHAEQEIIRMRYNYMQ